MLLKAFQPSGKPASYPRLLTRACCCLQVALGRLSCCVLHAHCGRFGSKLSCKLVWLWHVGIVSNLAAITAFELCVEEYKGLGFRVDAPICSSSRWDRSTEAARALAARVCR